MSGGENMGLLEGKVAVITGGGNGIGRAHALLFAEHGARLVVNDTGAALDGSGTSDDAAKVAQEICDGGGQAVADTTSVASFEGANAIIRHAVEEYGRIDILVNNAGILRDRTLLKMNPEEWQEVLDVHLTGTFACLQSAARQMKDQGDGGRIINTSSSSGLLGNFGQINYGAAKAGIHAVTRIASMELARHGITVNALAPNAYTRMTRDLPGMAGRSEETFGPQFMAPLVCFLASDKAAHITGQTFGVNVNHTFVYKMMTSQGVDPMSAEPWDPEALEGVMDSIINW
jgi:NAD(P)-dependent dehydrogenase (short-subunit alcohol dehydrogenase family)